LFICGTKAFSACGRFNVMVVTPFSFSQMIVSYATVAPDLFIFP